MTDALMILVVASTMGWRDPPSMASANAAFVPFHDMRACMVAKPLVILDAQRHGWEASAVCVLAGTVGEKP